MALNRLKENVLQNCHLQLSTNQSHIVQLIDTSLNVSNGYIQVGVAILEGGGGGGTRKNGVFTPTQYSFVLSCLRPKDRVFTPFLHDGVNLLAPSLPLRALQDLALLHFFIYKTYFVNINILEIITKFIISNQTNF